MRRPQLLWFLGIIGLIFFAILLEERGGLLAAGTKAPDFTANFSDGTTVSLNEYAGRKNVVLFFYPRDFTAGCTAQVCSMRDGYGEIEKLDAIVFGVSDDGYDSHSRFRERYSLPFQLIADTSRNLIRAFGVERLSGMVRSTKRVSYVIDKKGIIRSVVHKELNMVDHLADVLEALRSLDRSSTHKH